MTYSFVDEKRNIYRACAVNILHLNKMAALRGMWNFKHTFQVSSTVLKLSKNSIHSSSCLLTVQSSKVKITTKKNKPVTYEVSYAAPHIGFRKSWNSWNTSTLEGGLKRPQITVDDIFIRKFMYGTYPGLLLSEVIIKRQHNIIRISAIICPKISHDKLCFLMGYTEELLSYWFHAIVKVELQYLLDSDKMIFKYV